MDSVLQTRSIDSSLARSRQSAPLSLASIATGRRRDRRRRECISHCLSQTRFDISGRRRRGSTSNSFVPSAEVRPGRFAIDPRCLARDERLRAAACLPACLTDASEEAGKLPLELLSPERRRQPAARRRRRRPIMNLPNFYPTRRRPVMGPKSKLHLMRKVKR